MANVIVSRSNRLGIPLILAISMTSDGTNTTFAFNNHINIPDNFTGIVIVKLPMVVATSSQPVLFDTIGMSNATVPLYLNSGEQATVADITSDVAPTYHICVFDSVSNRLQLIA